jgi:GntR family histidine utilization transcriptional repressor
VRDDGALPLYRKVKAWMLAHIESGDWPEGHRVPSENDLVGLLDVSRMTANRAFRELTAEGRLKRVQGVGTFVALAPAQSEVVEIRNIADEVRERGHCYSCVVTELSRTAADELAAAELEVAEGSTVFRSVIVHRENDTPMQVEDRLVNPKVAPDYLETDFRARTPNAVLMLAAPLDRVEHTIEAVMPDRNIQRLLGIRATEPCLLVLRKTWSGGRVASFARLTHPGSRFRLHAGFDVHQSELTGRIRRRLEHEVSP